MTEVLAQGERKEETENIVVNQVVDRTICNNRNCLFYEGSYVKKNKDIIGKENDYTCRLNKLNGEECFEI